MRDSYYIYNPGSLVQKDNTIRFTTENGERRDLPVENISEIYIMNEMNVTTKLLNMLSKYGITTHYFNHYQFYIGSFYPKESKLAGQLLVKQALAYDNYTERMKLATEFIRSASFNIYRNLRYYNGRGKDVAEYMKNIEYLRKQLNFVSNIEQLMGIEGNIRKEYYKAWNIIIDQEISFEKRVYHPADNMINSLISFVNSLIYTKTLSEIYKTQLNPTISFLHQPGTRRFSLALDVSEVFKPLIADRLIFSLLNRNQITEKSFVTGLNGLQLTEKASKTIMQELDNKLQTTIFHKELNKNVSYQFLIRLELYKIVKHLLGEKEYKGFEIWW
ncbi:MAG: type I-B CRISPR-associated endonuclease Cas1b [Acutalibacteraceae bacterium]|nr:type I-B CRISPR-associated endonuclease Cas1b [Acutalibacteraceae bacterium]